MILLAIIGLCVMIWWGLSAANRADRAADAEPDLVASTVHRSEAGCYLIILMVAIVAFLAFVAPVNELAERSRIERGQYAGR
jgi:hypothetical protein